MDSTLAGMLAGNAAGVALSARQMHEDRRTLLLSLAVSSLVVLVVWRLLR